jgi:hypothetical protein
MNRADAEEFTYNLRQIVEGSYRQVALAAYRPGVPEALDLTPEQWLTGMAVRLSRVERREAVAELTAPEENGGMGLSQRQAGAVLGVDKHTVLRDLAGANAPPEAEKPSDGGANAPPEPEEPPEDPEARRQRRLAVEEAAAEARRQRRLEVWLARVREGLRTFCRMTGYPVPDGVVSGLTDEELALVRVILTALEEGSEENARRLMG